MRSTAAAQGRLIYLTNQLPFPPHSGGQLREAQLIRRLGRGFVIHLVVVTDEYERDKGWLPAALEHCASVSVFEADKQPAAGSTTPARVAGRANSHVAPYLEQLAAAEAVDFVHVEGYFLMQHVPRHLRLPVLLVEENIEYELDRDQGALGLRWDRHGWRHAWKIETECWRRATAVGVLSEADLGVVARVRAGGVFLLPNGADHLDAETRLDQDGPRPATGQTVVYAANYRWHPSLDGARHLLDDIWPAVRRRVATATLLLVGSGADTVPGATRPGTGVAVVGKVPCLAPVLHRATVVVTPLRYGGGVKMKVLEALSLGCALVATDVALAGIPREAARATIRANHAAEIADAVTGLLTDPRAAAALRDRARLARRWLPTWAAAAEQLRYAWRQMVLARADHRL